MPRYFVPHSGNIQPGDTLWDHGPTTNNNVKATRETDPDTGMRSTQMIGTAIAPIGGARIRPLGTNLVIDPTSKTGLVGSVVATLHVAAGAPAVPQPQAKPAPGLPPAKPTQPGGVDPNGAVPVDGIAGDPGKADDLLGEALTRDPDTGKLPKKPYIPDKWEDFKMGDDFWKVLKEEATR